MISALKKWELWCTASGNVNWHIPLESSLTVSAGIGDSHALSLVVWLRVTSRTAFYNTVLAQWLTVPKTRKQTQISDSIRMNKE